MLEDWGRTFSGKDAIATWDRNENTGVQSRIEATSVERTGATSVVGVQVSGNGYNGGGSFVFETGGGLIRRLEIRG